MKIGYWLKDPGEVGRRILEWWKNGFGEANIQYAISLILLAQPHSAAMERAFSQLTYIWRVTNRQGLEDQAYLRCMLRCNNKLIITKQIMYSIN